jgi:hypothetical protein
MRTREFINRSVFALDEIAESVLGVNKRGVRNMLAVSSLEKGVARWTDNGLHLKVSKDQLHMYLRPVVKT